MNPYQYSDNYISEKEFICAYPSIIIGVAVLELPSLVAAETSFSDGWISIFLAGVIFTVLAILAVKVAMCFPDQSFFSYTSFLVTRPIAITISLIYVIICICLGGYITRSISYISQQYLFNQTPMEVLALCFLLVVIYAISGERVGLFRLNMMFLPIILVIFIFVGVLNIKWYDTENFLPLFQTDINGYLKGMLISSEAFIGFGIGLFYIFLVRNPTNMTKNVVTGMSICILFYLFIFLSSIGVFGNLVTSNLMFPTIELAKRVDLPGGIFERIDAFIFTIWIMAIFNTVAMILDISILLLSSIFKKANKKMITFIIAPIVFYIGMFPQQTDQVRQASKVLSLISVFFSILIITSLFLIVKIRGVKREKE